MLPPDAQAELVAKFIDAELRSGGKGGKSDDELEATLEKALMLFRYIQARAALATRCACLHVCSQPAVVATSKARHLEVCQRDLSLIHNERVSDKCH